MSCSFAFGIWIFEFIIIGVVVVVVAWSELAVVRIFFTAVKIIIMIVQSYMFYASIFRGPQRWHDEGWMHYSRILMC